MKINCVSCGHIIDLRDNYDNFDGQVKCFACSGMLQMRTEEGEVKSVTLLSRLPLPQDPSPMDYAVDEMQ